MNIDLYSGQRTHKTADFKYSFIYMRVHICVAVHMLPCRALVEPLCIGKVASSCRLPPTRDLPGPSDLAPIVDVARIGSPTLSPRRLPLDNADASTTDWFVTLTTFPRRSSSTAVQ